MEKLSNLARDVRQFLCGSPRCLVTYLIHGSVMLIPLAVTIWVAAWLFNLVDGMLSPILTWGFGRPMPGLGFAIIIVSLVLIGYFGIKVGHRKAFDLIEGGGMRIPVLGSIYGGTRQVLTSFTTSTNSRYLEVIFMEFPRKGIYTVGLVTSKMTNSDDKSVLNVFIPTAPNPTSGFLQIVPEEDVIRTTLSVSDAMKLVISAGKVTRQDVADMLMQVPEPESKQKVLQCGPDKKTAE